MITITDWNLAHFEKVVLSIGNFDGVHRGHQTILERGRARARAAGTQLVVMTFEPHPSRLLTPDRVPATLTPLDYKLELLESAGVDATVVVRPSPEFLGVSAEQFVGEIIVGKFHPIAMVEGSTFGFGAHRKGDVEMLAARGSEHGFEVEIVEATRVALGGRPETIVSSSLIRHMLSSGTVDGAGLCLGRPYALRGVIQHGEARGRALGFPTANLSAGSQLVPAEGVYAGRAMLGRAPASPGVESRSHIAAAVSIGRNPTFNQSKLSIEAFLLDFDGDVYGEFMTLEFLEWLRPQQKFDSPDALREQIQRDVARTRELFNRSV